MDNEIWKPILGYEERYEVSNLGMIRKIQGRYAGRILKCFTDSDGYLCISLTKDYKSKSFFVHRLVAMTFIPNLENKPQVNHINGIKSDNRVENLEWVTASENMQHAWKNGLTKGNFGKHPTEKALRNIIEANQKAKKGTIWVNNGINSHMIKPEKIHEYLDNGYMLGRIGWA